MDDSSQQFVVVGSVRSGTTLLRLMLDHHPDISCMYDSEFMVAFDDEPANLVQTPWLDELQKDWHFTHINLTLPRTDQTYQEAVQFFYEERATQSGKKIIGATVHRDFHHLPKIFPNAKYIHMLRDGRAVSRSICAMGWAGNMYAGAKQWLCTMQQVALLKSVIPEKNFLVVHYDSLIGDAKNELARICEYLGTNYDEKMMSYSDNSSYSLPDPSKVHVWKQRIPAKEKAIAEAVAGPMLTSMGYELEFEPQRLGTVRNFMLSCDHWFKKKLFTARRYGFWLLLQRKLCRMFGFNQDRLEARYRKIWEAHLQ